MSETANEPLNKADHRRPACEGRQSVPAAWPCVMQAGRPLAITAGTAVIRSLFVKVFSPALRIHGDENTLHFHAI